MGALSVLEPFDRLWTQGLVKKYNKMKGFSSPEWRQPLLFTQKLHLLAFGQ